jgi:hypothetical protein
MQRMKFPSLADLQSCRQWVKDKKSFNKNFHPLKEACCGSLLQKKCCTFQTMYAIFGTQ